ncbi:hypothetical protein BC629DRAFT_431745 [Irpex lacteus]|nr:hypothetical protein BC629DRAFT_431745 [Irpex lacteus]
MCTSECFGNYHRKCNHYVKLYDSGVIKDCQSPNCALSKAHQHAQRPSRACTCRKRIVGLSTLSKTGVTRVGEQLGQHSTERMGGSNLSTGLAPDCHAFFFFIPKPSSRPHRSAQS